MGSKTEPRLPTPGEYVRLCGELVDVQDVTPPTVKVEDWIFKETTARVEMRVNGIRIKDCGTFNDFYGKGTCVVTGVAEAQKILINLGATDVELVVVRITSHCRRRPTRDSSFYDREFFEFKSLPSGSGWNLPEDTEDVVWSSKSGRATAG